jgi:Fusaric acid resistance protein-like
MLTTREAGYSWVGQQCVVTFLVASAFPASIEAAADRALLIISGGALQILFSAILFRLFGQLGAHLASLSRYIREEETALRTAVLETAHSMRQRKILNSALPYSLLLAITLGVTTEIYRQLHFPSGYWIPMTALLVLKPGVTDTVNRAIARVSGTLAGAILVSFCIAHLNPSPLPGLAAVEGAIDAALRVCFVDVAESGDVHAVGVGGVDDDLADLTGFGEADVMPGLPASVDLKTPMP